MIKKLLHSKFASQTIWAFGGQISYLLANFLLFIILVNQVPTEVYGTWALYITIISIADSLRQGMVQNGLSRLMIAYPTNLALKSTGTTLNFTLIAILGVILAFVPGFLSNDEALVEVLKHAWKGLLAIGAMMFIATFCQSKQQFKTYFLVNLIYFITFVSILLWIRYSFESISLINIINIQFLSMLPAAVFYLFKTKIHFTLPSRRQVTLLFHFGKYATGTNLLSMLFHKADIIMIAFLLDPVAVGIYHFATKMMNYAELPLHAFSQVIYPRITSSFRTGSALKLKREYALSTLRLLAFVVPISLLLILFREQFILILADHQYLEAKPLIMILSLGMMWKPLGRVFGLTLDAIGKPKINFFMLLLSFGINLTMNLILIPPFGATGAAWATTISIVITILIGQISLAKRTPIRPLRDMIYEIKNIYTNRKNLDKGPNTKKELILN